MQGRFANALSVCVREEAYKDIGRLNTKYPPSEIKAYGTARAGVPFFLNQIIFVYILNHFFKYLYEHGFSLFSMLIR